MAWHCFEDRAELKSGFKPSRLQQAPIMNKLNESHFSFKCPMSFEGMTPSENGRFCDRCRKEVFDLTDCSLEEVDALQKKHGQICGSIRVAQVAAVAALSLSAAACQDGKVVDHLPRPSDSKCGMASGTIFFPIHSLLNASKD
ncbi:MAG: hypothetical protein CFE26_15845 [Verrucomicrobiales bacterium VVV1]|nr:MAG: hypothetical protein CFE26_15845 [Verrucomicrobiales bacterium VVV1]